jgi:hypothetical protein
LNHIAHPPNHSSVAIREVVAQAASDVLFIGDPRVSLEAGPGTYDRMAQVIRETGAGLVYSDAVEHPRIDYQLGSIRDNFDFGPLIAISVKAAREADLDRLMNWGGLYELRLRLSERYPIVRIPEPLYTADALDTRTSGQKQFDYVDPRNREYQIEMEKIATEHLKRIGAYLRPGSQVRYVPVAKEDWPTRASVIIPVRNRERTILDSVNSALGQQTSFSFNIIVVDNHSTDKTTSILRSVKDPRLVHMIPQRRNLGIGGCWNEAIQSSQCGRYAVQLDSDDLYQSEHALAHIVKVLEEGPYAMVIGSYSMVDFSLNPIPPGLIDHREWTRENGANNALRINGLGAPRAFDTSVLRSFGFPNVSYGEDYAVSLRITRQFEIGRIYEPVYLCRRWDGNTDSALPLETSNRYDAYKDWIRTNEIRARQLQRS